MLQRVTDLNKFFTTPDLTEYIGTESGVRYEQRFEKQYKFSPWLKVIEFYSRAADAARRARRKAAKKKKPPAPARRAAPKRPKKKAGTVRSIQPHYVT